MTELEYFRLFAPEFVAVSDETVNTWLTVAGNLANVGCLDVERASMALALYAAHLLKLSQTQGSGAGSASGPVTKEKEGDLERTYAATTVQGSDSWLGQTPYGLQYSDITNACYGSAIMTRVEL